MPGIKLNPKYQVPFLPSDTRWRTAAVAAATTAV